METKEMYNVVEKLYHKIGEAKQFIANNRLNLVGLNAYALFISIYDDMKYLAENHFFGIDASVSALRTFIKIDILKSHNHSLELDIYLANTKYEIESTDFYDDGRFIYTFEITNESRQDSVIPEINRRREYLVKIILNIYDRLDKYMKKYMKENEDRNNINESSDISLENQLEELQKETSLVNENLRLYLNKMYNCTGECNRDKRVLKDKYDDIFLNILNKDYNLRKYINNSEVDIANAVKEMCDTFNVRRLIALGGITFEQNTITISKNPDCYVDKHKNYYLDDIDDQDIRFIKIIIIILKIFIKKYINKTKEANNLLKSVLD